MRIPKKIIGRGGITYEVVQMKKIPTVTAETLDGYFDEPNQKIYLRSDLAPQQKASTLLHECIHMLACDFENYDLCREEYVRLLERDLLMLLVINKLDFAA